MTDAQVALTNARNELKWIVRLLGRLDEHTAIPSRPEDFGPDGEPDPPVLEEFECKVILQSTPWTIRTVRNLGEAAIRDIESLLPRTGA